MLRAHFTFRFSPRLLCKQKSQDSWMRKVIFPPNSNTPTSRLFSGWVGASWGDRNHPGCLNTGSLMSGNSNKSRYLATQRVEADLAGSRSGIKRQLLLWAEASAWQGAED